MNEEHSRQNVTGEVSEVSEALISLGDCKQLSFLEDRV